MKIQTVVKTLKVTVMAPYSESESDSRVIVKIEISQDNEGKFHSSFYTEDRANIQFDRWTKGESHPSAIIFGRRNLPRNEPRDSLEEAEKTALEALSKFLERPPQPSQSL